MATHLAAASRWNRSEVLRRVLEERELLASTAIGDGIAIPHGKLDSVNQLVGRWGARCRAGVRLHRRQADASGLHAGGAGQLHGIHLKALARLSRLFRDALFRQRLIEAPDASAMYRVITEEDAKY
jgi:PTS system nitrogen regulatory IIA component